MNRLFAIFSLLLVTSVVRAQDTTQVALPDTSANSLLASLTDSVAAPDLLPRHMSLAQRLLWSRKGLFRITNLAPLTPEGREKELKIRRTMLASHQIAGFVTLAGMIAQGFVGARLYKAQGADYVRIKNTHENLATFVNVAYGTTAVLSLTSPPRLPTATRRRGVSSIQLHKALAFVHLTGMVATNILGRRTQNSGENYQTIKTIHRAVAFTTFGAFAASIIVIKF